MKITTEENRISIDGVSYPKDGFYVKPIPKGVALVAMSKSWSIKILVDDTTIDGSPVADRDELMTFFNEQGFKSGGTGPGTESVQSVTGDGVGGTPENPVLSYPTPEDIGAATKEYVDEQNAFNVEDVTQEAYIDKAINVKAFNNTGMSYSEGSIDFGITRNSTHTMGAYAFKLGVETTASGDHSLAFGSGTTANEYASIAIGQYSTDGPAQTAPVSGSPIFKVGNGTNPSNRSNAYVLYNDGRSEQIKDVEVKEIGQGVVIKSPDGTRWRITVDNNGDLTTTSL